MKKKVLKGKSFTKKTVASNKAKKKKVVDKGKCEVKHIINRRMTELGNKNGVAIALDGQEMNSYKALIDAGWKKNQIYLPNISEDYYILKKKHKQSFPLSLGKMITRVNNMEKKIGYVYMDYMCHFYGNKTQEVDPREDLISLFEGKQLLNKSIIGITCSHRSKFGPKNIGFTNPSMIEAIGFITKAAYINGYSTVMEEKVSGTYFNGGPMFTLIFKIFKVKK